MPGLVKLLIVVLIIGAAWYIMRWFNRVHPQMAPRRPAQPRARKPMIEAEDLVPCRACGTYMPVSARNCGKPACPLPR
jgi:hypothetical protein